MHTHRATSPTGRFPPVSTRLSPLGPGSLAAFRVTARRHMSANSFGCEDPSDPVAIISMSCRLPGGVNTPEDFWELLTSGRSVASAMPEDRGWNLDRMFRPQGSTAGTCVTRSGCFVSDIAEFDPEFFGIAEREATAMAPEQRVTLLTAWEAFERAGIRPRTLRGEDVGVFLGYFGTDDYGPAWDEVPPQLRGRVLTGTSPSVLAGRLSYVLGTHGPAVSVDTACSGSLVALHLACQSLRSGETVLALAGGATFHARPGIFTEFSKAGALSPDGVCKSFSDDADGTGWGEGVGVLLLARLSEARRRGWPVLATVRASAINHDGPSRTLTAPNGEAQQRMIQRTLAEAGLRPAEVDVVEAHGTGTPLGDPIEVTALQAVYGDRPADRPLLLGSAKSNIGHTLAAAGVSGVIKTVLSLQHALVPPTLHVSAPNRRFDWAASRIRLATETTPWPETGRPRRGAVSSFGVSGTNAHAIIEQAPDAPGTSTESTGPGPAAAAEDMPHTAWVLSGRTPEALREQAARLKTHIERHPGLRLVDVGFTLAERRTRFEHQAVVTGGSTDELIRALGVLSRAGLDDALVTGRPPEHVVDNGRPAVFVFPGQGSQWIGMGVELAAASEVFNRRLQECEEALAPYCDWSLRDVLAQAPGAPTLDRAEVVQPALFAVMVSLAALWESCGIRPAAVIGHSQGEIAAACVCGALSLQDAAKVVALRSRTLGGLSGDYSMASVALAHEEVEQYLAGRGSAVSVAVVNGPRATVVAGPRAELRRIVADLEAVDVRARMVPVDYASHSPQVEEVREQVLAALSGITPRPSTVPFYSAVTGTALDTAGLTADYWYRNLRAPVRFDLAVQTALEADFGAFVEVSPHPVLAASVEQVAEAAGADDVLSVGSLRRDDGGWDRFSQALATAHVGGLPLGAGYFAPWRPRLTDLPTYAFQTRRLWLEPAVPTPAAVSGAEPTGHAWLGSALSLAETGGHMLAGRLSGRAAPWLADHRVGGRAVVPGAAVVEMAVRAGDEAGCDTLLELTQNHPLPLSDEEHVDLQVTVGGADADGRHTVTVFSRSSGPAGATGTDSAGAGWTRHAEGVLLRSASQPAAGPADAAWPPADARPVPVEELYARYTGTAIDYGPAFRAVTTAWAREGELYAEAALPDDAAPGVDAFGLHPVLLDAALHVTVLARPAEGPRPTMLPFAWHGVRLHRAGATRLRVRATVVGDDAFRLALFDDAGHPVLDVDRLVMLPASDRLFGDLGRHRDAVYRQAWRPVGDTPAEAPAGGWALAGDPAPAVPVSAAATCPAYPDLDAVRAAAGGGSAPAGVLWAVPCTGDRPVVAVLDPLRRWLADASVLTTRLVLVTSGAVAARDGEVDDPEGAALWGLVRSVQTEHPDRVVLVDTDAHPDSPAAVLAAASGPEPQVAVRAGVASALRLVRTAPGPRGDGDGLAPEGTVLVTGGSGTLGALVARHLVVRHGVRRLVLVSRRGTDAPGALELRESLTELGASVRIEACDVTRREQVAALLDSLDHPLTAVVHTAGVLADRLVESMTAQDVARVMAAKADAARHLDELTRDQPLSAFVLFSSCVATLGNAGQGNYAAANAYLEALARGRRAAGLPATAMAWGLWAERSEMTAGVDTSSFARLIPGVDVTPLPTETGLDLFDVALAAEAPALVLMTMTPPAADATVPPLLRELRQSPRRRAEPTAAAGAFAGASVGGLGRDFEALDAAGRLAALTEVVHAQAAAVLGERSAALLTGATTFKSVGLESLSAVELRNRLAAAVGCRLVSTVVFDHPTPARLAAHLMTVLDPGGMVAPLPAVASATPSAPAAPAGPAPTVVSDEQIDEMDLGDLLALAGVETAEPGTLPGKETDR
ncbi:type I polyketide synthase [Streptomyces sp. NPDC048106]|uniref:type I polyketide synthase n=1 Tax=Streptomyces sp. NPDC048106 TaxID=3155750 RepID=UPI003454ACF9